MANDSSYDIVSTVDLQELNNAVVQANKEITQRYDFKNSKSELTINDEEIKIKTEDDFKLASILDILKTKMIKRGVPIRNLDYGKIEQASGGLIRQAIKIKQGIETETAKKITRTIKDSKIKVQVQILGDQVRVSGKSKDDLQNVMQLIKEQDFGVDLQFTNYR